MDEIYKNYNFPEIKMEGLSKTEYEHRCKYLRLYFRIIDRCKNMTEEELSGYCEKHHILPKCMGGENDKENLVKMPIRYHLIAHLILINIYPNNNKLHYAVHRLFFSKKLEIVKAVNKHISTKTVAYLKEDNIKNRSGKNHPLYGKPRSEETKRKLSESQKGRTIPEERKLRISKSLKGRKLSKEHIEKLRQINTGVIFSKERRENISNALKGKSLSEITKKRMSESRRGEKHPLYGKHRSEDTKRKISESKIGKESKIKGIKSSSSTCVVGPDGTIYGSIREASRLSGVGRDKIMNVISGKTKKDAGSWKIIDKQKAKELLNLTN